VSAIIPFGQRTASDGRFSVHFPVGCHVQTIFPLGAI